MSRIRSIHPRLFTDDAFMAASPHARLLFIGLWGECFDDGVFEWKPLTLKARLLPVDNVDVAELLIELQTLNCVMRFNIGDRSFGAVRNFRRFQRPKKPKPSGVLPDEFGTYVGSQPSSSELDNDEDGDSSEPKPVKTTRVPPKSEKSFQKGGREEGREEPSQGDRYLNGSGQSTTRGRA